MSDFKNFSPEIIMGSRPSASRGITDDHVEPESSEPVPSAQVMIDALYYAMSDRLDAIEAKLDRLLGE